MNIPNDTLSYIVGFLHADGNLYETTRNRGRLQIELSHRDKDILVKINDIFEKRGYIRDRTRDTNYKKNYKSSALAIYHKDIRDYLKSFGIANKKTLVHIPEGIDIYNYIRGYIDGNGSIGYTALGFPFLSITTPSKLLKESICDFFFSITGKQKNINPNNRDKIYNIILNREDAQKVAHLLYEKAKIYLNRKYNSYKDIMKWKRPSDIRKRTEFKRWSDSQDTYIQTHSISKSMEYLDRTKTSIGMRLWRLKKRKNKIKEKFLCLQ